MLETSVVLSFHGGNSSFKTEFSCRNLPMTLHNILVRNCPYHSEFIKAAERTYEIKCSGESGKLPEVVELAAFACVKKTKQKTQTNH